MVHYRVVGQGEPIILVHGLSGSSRWWVRNVPSLAKHYQVYLIDLPGFGAMHRFHARFVLDEVSSWVMSWMKAVGISRAHLIGHSMGGYICIWIAAHQPEVVDHLVLVSPAGIPRVRSLLGYAIPLVVALRYLTPSFFPILLYDALRAGPLTLLRAAQDLLTKDVRDCLHSIVAPTLLIWGEDDALVPPLLGDILHKEIAHSQFMTLKKAGHVGMFDQPQRFNAAVLTFLAEELQRPPAKIAVPPPHLLSAIVIGRIPNLTLQAVFVLLCTYPLSTYEECSLALGWPSSVLSVPCYWSRGSKNDSFWYNTSCLR